MTKYPHLFTSLKVGNLTMRNRIEASATSLQIWAPGDRLTRESIAYYERKAKGGAAMVIIGETPVERKSGKSHVHMLHLDDPEIIYNLGYVTEAIHKHGAIASLQIAHGGAGCDPAFLEIDHPIGPTGGVNANGVYIEEMDEKMIEHIVNKFGDAARTLQIGGFDMCQLHAGHSWLLGQFLSPGVNKRTDKFGGSIENRLRIVEMCIDNIRQKTHGDFPIELRISGDEFYPDGFHLDTCVEYCKLLDGKVDLFNISSGSIFAPGGVGICTPSIYEKRVRNAYLAEEIKKHVKTPVVAVGALTRPEDMEELIANGKADMVCCARATLADPEFPNKLRDGREDEMRPCVRCMYCMSSMMSGNKHIHCSVNPTLGYELTNREPAPKAEEKKKVLVVGGGVAGIQAALTSAERGHEVILCEKTDRLGGVLNYTEHVSFKDDIVNYLNWARRMVAKSSIDLRLNTEVTPDYIRKVGPDAVICAVGADIVIPPIPGVENIKVIDSIEMHEQAEKLGDNIVIIGAGITGIEGAIHMRMMGKNVQILEAAGGILKGIEMQQLAVTMEEMRRMDLLDKYHTNTKVVKIDDNGVTAETPEGTVVFPADNVVMCTGMRARRDLVESLRPVCLNFRNIGDCLKPRRMPEAVSEGYFAALDI